MADEETAWELAVTAQAATKVPPPNLTEEEMRQIREETKPYDGWKGSGFDPQSRGNSGW